MNKIQLRKAFKREEKATISELIGRLIYLATLLFVAWLTTTLDVHAGPQEQILENVALGKNAVASSTESSALLPHYANDGNPKTRWSSDWDDNQWISIDLAASYQVQEIILNWEAAYGTSYDIQRSFDGIQWETIYEERNGNGGTDLINFGSPVPAQFVRMVGLERGTTFGFSLWEFEIYGSDPTQRYVAPDGIDGGNNCLDAEAPCATITHAIEQANIGNTIEIAAGTYTESFTIDKSLALQGAGESETIIQANTVPDIASSRVISIPVGSAAIISDVTIRHGKATGSGTAGQGGGIHNSSDTLTLTNVSLNDNVANFGGGMFNVDSSPVLSNVTLRRNRAEGNSGGGMYNTRSSPTLTDVSFIDNSATVVGGGMRNFDNSSPTLTDVFFIANVADRGGGMGNNSGSAVLEQVTFLGNIARLGGALYNVNSAPQLSFATIDTNSATENGGGLFNTNSSPTLLNVVITDNSAGNGGGIYNFNNSSPSLVNTEISYNQATGGGGLFNFDNSSPALTNVTISGNEADVVGGGILNLNSSPTLRNTIIWGNMAGSLGHEIYNEDDASITLHYSLYKNQANDIVEGGGFNVDQNSLTDDPLFLDTTNDDLRLQENSPAVNAGDPATELSLFPVDDFGNPVDLDGNRRIVDERIDMGPWEFNSHPSALYLPLTTG